MFASALSRNHCDALGADTRSTDCERALAEVVGVGEEERRVVAVDDEAGHRLGVGVVVDVVHAGDARARSRGRRRAGGRCGAAGRARTARWPPRPRGARRRRARRPWSRARGASSLRRKPAIRRSSRDVDEPDRGEDDDGAEGRGREGAKTGPQAEQRRDDEDERDERVQLGAAAERVGDRGAAAAGADREALDRPVATLAVPSARNSWLLSMCSRCRAAKARPVSTLSENADDGDAERRRQQGATVGDARRRAACRARQTLPGGDRRRATRAGREVEDGDDTVASSIAMSGTGQPRREALEGEEDDEHAERQGQRRQVRCRRGGSATYDSSWTNELALDGEAGDLAELADDHERRDPAM